MGQPNPPGTLGRWGAVLRSGSAGLALALLSVPFLWSWLAPLPLALLFHELSQAGSRRRAFLLAFVAGLTFFGRHLGWLFVSFTRLFGPVGGLLTLLVVPLLALSWGLIAFLAFDRSSRQTLLVLPLVWVVGAPSGKLRLLAKGLNKRAKADLAAHAHALACLSEGMFRSVLDVPGTDTASPG